METQTNNQGQKVTLFFSKYGYKRHTLVGKNIYYEGTTSNCPEELLDVVELSEDYTKHLKFVRVWD